VALHLPPLGHLSGHPLRFLGAPVSTGAPVRTPSAFFRCSGVRYDVMKSTPGAINSVLPNKSVNVPLNATFSKWPPSQINCLSLQTVESCCTWVSKNRFVKLKDFALKMHSMLWSIYVRDGKFFAMKQVISKHRNRMTDETLGDSLWLTTNNTGLIGTILSKKPRSLIDICNKLLLCNNFSDALASLLFQF